MKLNVCAIGRQLGCWTVGEPDGMLRQEMALPPKHRRAFVFTGGGKARGRERAIEYAREHGGTVFGPTGKIIEECGPVQYHD